MLRVGQRSNDDRVHHDRLIRQRVPYPIPNQSGLDHYITDVVSGSVTMTML